MKTMGFQFSRGSHLPQKRAQEIGGYLHHLESTTGPLTPAAVVEAATPADSPIHDLFQWDDAKAAVSYREQQARHLLAALQIRYVDGPSGKPGTMRAFYNVAPVELDTRAYVPTIKVLQDEDLRRQMLFRALSELRAFEKKYRELEELTMVFEAMAQVQKAA